jgi:hypothetical protein
MTMTTKSLLCTSVAALLSLSSAKAGLITQFGFNAAGNGNNINEATGWDGTTAGAGGSLDANLTLSQTLRVGGSLVAGSGEDVFHVDNWHSAASDRANQITLGNSVRFTVAANAGYEINLGTGVGSFSTRMHDHFTGSNGNLMFDRVALFINGVDLGDQTYTRTTYGPEVPSVAQTLTWSFGANPLLNGLSSAQAQLYFWASDGAAANPAGDDAHGPEWAAGDSANMILNGSVDLIAVPEPATFAVGAGLFLVGALRRRRSAR